MKIGLGADALDTANGLCSSPLGAIGLLALNAKKQEAALRHKRYLRQLAIAIVLGTACLPVQDFVRLSLASDSLCDLHQYACPCPDRCSLDQHRGRQPVKPQAAACHSDRAGDAQPEASGSPAGSDDLGWRSCVPPVRDSIQVSERVYLKSGFQLQVFIPVERDRATKSALSSINTAPIPPSPPPEA